MSTPAASTWAVTARAARWCYWSWLGSDRFRAAFAFGPVASPLQYGDSRLLARRRPGQTSPSTPFLSPAMAERKVAGQCARSGDAPVHFATIPNANHFNTLAPTTEMIAAKILADTGPSPKFDLDVNAIERGAWPARRIETGGVSSSSAH